MNAWVRGQKVELEAGLAAAADLLGAARMPVIAGLAADVDGIRAAFRLAARIGAFVDPISADSLYADLSALAGAGSVPTTPSEAVTRADVVVAVGPGAAASPLLREIEATSPVVGPGAGARSVLVLATGPAIGNVPVMVDPGPEGLGPALGILRAHAAGRLTGSGPLPDLARRLAQARFAVLLYDPADLGDLGVEMLQGLAADLNEATRVFTLPVADTHQGRLLLQVSAWTTGQGPRVGFGRGRPEHDPHRFDAARAIAAGEVEALLWLAPCPAPRPDWSRAVPSVAVVSAADGSEADVVLDAGEPGRDVPGVLWDGRRGAFVFREATQPGAAPRAADLLDALVRHLPPRDSISQSQEMSC